MQSTPAVNPIFRRKKGRKFYIQLMITMICIGIVPPLIMNIAAYNKMSANFYRESGSNNIKYLDQTMKSIEIIVNQILSSSQQLMLNGSVRDFERFPNGAYYQHLQGAFESSELTEHYNFLKHKQLAFDNIRKFKLSNTFVMSVYFYESESRMVYAIDRDNIEISQAFDQFYDRDWYPYLERNAVSPLFTDTRNAQIGNDESTELLSIVLRTGMNNNAVVINLEASKVYKQIFDKINFSEELFVTNESGEILLHRDNRMLHENIAALFSDFRPNAETSGYFRSEWNKGAVLVSYSKSGVLDWWFVNVVELDKLLQAQSYLKQTIVLFSALLVASVVCLSILSSKRLYRPFSFTLQERDYFKGKLEESLPHYRERFKLSLLQPHSLTEQQIKEKLNELQADVPIETPIVWLISRDSEPRSRNDTDGAFSTYLDEIRMAETTREYLDTLRNPWAMIETGGDHIAIVVSSAKGEMSSVFRSAEQLLQFLADRLGADLTIGISLPSDSVTQLPRAYTEAQEALKYRIVWGGGQVIYYGDVAMQQKAHVYPSRTAELLCSSIKLGNREKAIGVFKEWMEEIQRQRKSVHYDQIMPVYIRLLNDILSAIGETGYDMQKINKGLNLYRDLIELRSPLKVSLWFEDFILETVDRILEEQQLTGNQHIEKAKQIINRDFTKDVSLQSVSDELKLSPNYISRLFKQSTGKSFVDYVTSLRVERAKSLLTEQNLKVNEISRMVGYHNSYYFIKVFKEFTGVTPGEYRKLSMDAQ